MSMRSLLELVAFCDGASRGNPGPSGSGTAIFSLDGKPIARFGIFLEYQTNNVAEYEGIILGLHKAHDFGATSVQIYSDSEVVVRQLRGEYQVRSKDLRPYFTYASALRRWFQHVEFSWIRRDKNIVADALSNWAIDVGVVESHRRFFDFTGP